MRKIDNIRNEVVDTYPNGKQRIVCKWDGYVIIGLIYYDEDGVVLIWDNINDRDAWMTEFANREYFEQEEKEYEESGQMAKDFLDSYYFKQKIKDFKNNILRHEESSMNIDIVKMLSPENLEVYNKIAMVSAEEIINSNTPRNTDDYNKFMLELTKEMNDYRKKVLTKKSTGESKELTQKKEKLRKLYFKLKEKGYSQKEAHNLLKVKHFPKWSIDTIISYLKK